jgi:hypothetical protein
MPGGGGGGGSHWSPCEEEEEEEEEETGVCSHWSPCKEEGEEKDVCVVSFFPEDVCGSRVGDVGVHVPRSDMTWPCRGGCLFLDGFVLVVVLGVCRGVDCPSCVHDLVRTVLLWCRRGSVSRGWSRVGDVCVRVPRSGMSWPRRGVCLFLGGFGPVVVQGMCRVEDC